jgi:exodeoxyribonuclease-3
VFTVATVNVNGIRAAFRRGMGEWLTTQAPDLLCLQEIRATDEVLAEQFAEHGGVWHFAHSEPNEDNGRGRAGVAVVSRDPILAVRDTVGPAEFDGYGRWVEADLLVNGAQLTAVSVYVHAGDADSPRQVTKYGFLQAMSDRMEQLRADGRHVLVCGDFNIAHREEDLKNWKGNLKKSGFLPDERAYLDRLFGAHEWSDVLRTHHPDVAGPYSWWSWRGQAFDNDTGWRIDYQVASRGLAALATRAWIDRAPTYAQRWSDHAPVNVSYDL